MSEIVPRFRQQYTRDQCDSRSTLVVMGWGDDDIERLLGEPDAKKQRGGAAYGADRALLGAMSDSKLLQQIPEYSRPKMWLKVLLEDEPSEEYPAGAWIHLEGYPWRVLCQSIDAMPGNLIWVKKRSGVLDCKKIATVAAQWGDFALVTVRSTGD